ncbi:MAG TPA: class I SAM-dependent methyltransferase [Stellaceae bacterium]|nr:class I SAM-dependent methyltransferase [Stellaceae bacterium]
MVAAGNGAWRDFYQATADRPPRATLLEALRRFPPSPPPRFAIDLGCGTGRDTIELLRRHWSVLAIDAEPEALRGFHEQARPGLETRLARMEEVTLPPCDLVNASFSLPLCPPSAFPALWARIGAALKPEGRFAGQLYGDRDGWAGRPGMTHLTRGAVEDLLRGFAIEHFVEEESDGVTPRGAPKHWHIFHLVLRR